MNYPIASERSGYRERNPLSSDFDLKRGLLSFRGPHYSLTMVVLSDCRPIRERSGNEGGIAPDRPKSLFFSSIKPQTV